MIEALSSIFSVSKDKISLSLLSHDFQHADPQISSLRKLAEISERTAQIISVQFESGGVGLILNTGDTSTSILLLANNNSHAYQLKQIYSENFKSIQSLISESGNEQQNDGKLQFLANYVSHVFTVGKFDQSIFVEKLHENHCIVALIKIEQNIRLGDDLVRSLQRPFNGQFTTVPAAMKYLQDDIPVATSVSVIDINTKTDEIYFMSSGLPFLFKSQETYYNLKPSKHSNSKIWTYDGVLNRGDELYMINTPGGDGASTQQKVLKTLQQTMMKNAEGEFDDICNLIKSQLGELPDDFGLIGMKI